jgi:hypothetical protein
MTLVFPSLNLVLYEIPINKLLQAVSHHHSLHTPATLKLKSTTDNPCVFLILVLLEIPICDDLHLMFVQFVLLLWRDFISVKIPE